MERNTTTDDDYEYGDGIFDVVDDLVLRYEPEVDCIVQTDQLTGQEIDTFPCDGNDPEQVADDLGIRGEWV